MTHAARQCKRWKIVVHHKMRADLHAAAADFQRLNGGHDGDGSAASNDAALRGAWRDALVEPPIH